MAHGSSLSRICLARSNHNYIGESNSFVSSQHRSETKFGRVEGVVIAGTGLLLLRFEEINFTNEQEKGFHNRNL